MKRIWKMIELPNEGKLEMLDFYRTDSHLWSCYLRPTPEWVANAFVSSSSVALWVCPESNTWGLKTAIETKSCQLPHLHETSLNVALPARGGGSFYIGLQYSESISKESPVLGDGEVGRSQCPLVITYGAGTAFLDWYLKLNLEISTTLAIKSSFNEVLDV